MKLYQIIKQNHKIAEYDEKRADNASFWDDQWMSSSIKNSLEKAQKGYMGGMDFLLAELNKSEKILEAGCGKGQIVQVLDYRGFNIEGIDFAKNTIQKINEISPSLKVKVGDIMDIPYDDDYFDVYLSFGVIEHFTNQDALDKIFSELKRVTKKKVLITVPYLSPALSRFLLEKDLSPETSNYDFYQYYFSKTEISQLLQSYGLKTYKIEYYATYIGLKRYNKFFQILLKFKAFKFFLFKNRSLLDKIFGHRYGHMMACWAYI
jgi:ubiquinone/menaquinone biosynthesis C-methylase UbiE